MPLTHQEQIIRQEILVDPTGAGYKNMTDQEIADYLNAKTIVGGSTKVNLNRKLLVKLFGLTRASEIMSALRTAAANGDLEAELGIELLAEQPEVSEPDTQIVIDAFVTKGIITAAEADKIKKAGVVMLSRAQVIGVPDKEVLVEWVTKARATI